MKNELDNEFAAELLTLVQDTDVSKEVFIKSFVKNLVIAEKKSQRNPGGRLQNSDNIKYFLALWFKAHRLTKDQGTEMVLPQALFALQWPYHQIHEILGIPESRLPLKGLRIIERELKEVDGQESANCALNDLHLVDALLERPWTDLEEELSLEVYKHHRKNCLRCSKLSRETRKLLLTYQERRVRKLPEEVAVLLQKRSLSFWDDIRETLKSPIFQLVTFSLSIAIAGAWFYSKDFILEISKSGSQPIAIAPVPGAAPVVPEVAGEGKVPEKMPETPVDIVKVSPVKIPTEIPHSDLSQKEAPVRSGFIRMGVRSASIEQNSEAILKILKKLDAHQEGKYQLGARHLGGRYFHFNLPVQHETELRKQLKELKLSEPTEDFVSSEAFKKSGHVRFILWLGPIGPKR
jgi:hypothetical protein